MADSKYFLRCLFVLSLVVLPVLVGEPASALSQTFGALDSVMPNNNGTAVVSGWAATSDNKTQALGVRARIDGNLVLAPNEYRFANKSRPDVAANVCCGYSPNLGFTFTIPWPADLPATSHHTVCIEAQNSGVYNQISCLPENIPGRTNPIISQTTVNRWNFFGGTYDLFPGVAVNVSYFRPADGFAGNIDLAMNSWQASATNIYRVRTLTAGTANIEFRTLSGNPGYLGLATEQSGLCDPISNVSLACIRNRSIVNMATGQLAANLQAANTQYTAAHEAGHAFGLGHPRGGSSSVMNQGLVGPSVVDGIASTNPQTPSAADETKVNTLYPRQSGTSL